MDDNELERRVKHQLHCQTYLLKLYICPDWSISFGLEILTCPVYGLFFSDPAHPAVRLFKIDREIFF
jgi:hypothetical protein